MLWEMVLSGFRHRSLKEIERTNLEISSFSEEYARKEPDPPQEQYQDPEEVRQSTIAADGDPCEGCRGTSRSQHRR